MGDRKASADDSFSSGHSGRTGRRGPDPDRSAAADRYRHHCTAFVCKDGVRSGMGPAETETLHTEVLHDAAPLFSAKHGMEKRLWIW